MKKFRKVMSLVLALALVFGLSATAFAAEVSAADENSPYSITIENAVAEHTYSAYKIFDATYDGEGHVAYSTASSSDLYTYISAVSYTVSVENDGVTSSATYYNPFNFTETSSGVYTVTVKAGYEDADIINFLNAAIASIIKDNSITAAKTGTATANGTLTLYLDEPGYYFVTSTLGSVVSITTADPDAVIIEKNNPPGDLHKYIVSGLDEDDTQHGDAEAVGDDVKFEITANVPLYAPGDSASPEGYLVTDYEFIDHMSAGLEIRGLTTEVNATYESTCDYYTVEEEDEDTGESVIHYYATKTLINKWITIKDGGTSYNLTDVAYEVILELTDVSEYDDNGDGTADGIQFDGFTLSYNTIDLDYYQKNIQHDDDGTAVGYDTAYELVEALRTANACSYPVNATIEIDYTAHVTGDAAYDNTNDVEMDWHVTPYRNPNPLNPEYGGEVFDSDDVYVLQLEILKVDGSDITNVLAGAEFQLTGTNLQDVVTNEHEEYTSIESYAKYEAAKTAGTELWFAVAGGTYTNVDPYELAKANPDDPALNNYVVNEYSLDPGTYPDAASYTYVAYTMEVSYSSGVQSADMTTKTVTGTTDEEGLLIFKGLTVGEWILTEIKAPDGYNLLPDDFGMTIGVTWSVDTSTGKIVPTWTLSGDDSNVYSLDTATGVISITVENNAGTELPGTGGIGTTWFYIIGAILVCGAVVVLVTRRRVNAKAA